MTFVYTSLACLWIFVVVQLVQYIIAGKRLREAIEEAESLIESNTDKIAILDARFNEHHSRIDHLKFLEEKK